MIKYPHGDRMRARRARSASLGRSLAVSSALLFGLNGVLTHWFIAAGGETVALLALRFIAGGVVFAIVAVVSAMPMPPLRDAGAAVVTGLGHVGFTACLLWGFSTSSVALTVLLFYTYPLLVALGAAALYGEPLTRGRLRLIGLGTAGVALAVGTPTGATPGGILFGLGAGFGASAVILGNRALLKRGLRVEQMATVNYLAPATCFTVLALAGVLPAPPGTVEAWAPALGYCLFGTVLPNWLFYTAVTHIGVSLASLLATLEPLVAVLFAWLLISEPLELGQLAGGVLILTAVAALSVQKGDPVGVSEALPSAAPPPVAPPHA